MTLDNQTAGIENGLMAIAAAVSGESAFGQHIHLRRATSQALPGTTQTIITGFSVISNEGNYTFSSSNITIESDGIYAVIANVTLDGTSIRADLAITGTSAQDSINQAFGKLSCTTVERIAAGTNISVALTNNSAAANLSSANLQVIRLA